MFGTRVTPLRSVILMLFPDGRGGACSSRKNLKQKNGSTKALPYRRPVVILPSHRVILERSEGSRWETNQNLGAALLKDDRRTRRASNDTTSAPANAKRTPEGVLCVVCSDLNRCLPNYSLT